MLPYDCLAIILSFVELSSPMRDLAPLVNRMNWDFQKSFIENNCSNLVPFIKRSTVIKYLCQYFNLHQISKDPVACKILNNFSIADLFELNQSNSPLITLLQSPSEITAIDDKDFIAFCDVYARIPTSRSKYLNLIHAEMRKIINGSEVPTFLLNLEAIPEQILIFLPFSKNFSSIFALDDNETVARILYLKSKKIRDFLHPLDLSGKVERIDLFTGYIILIIKSNEILEGDSLTKLMVKLLYSCFSLEIIESDKQIFKELPSRFTEKYHSLIDQVYDSLCNN